MERSGSGEFSDECKPAYRVGGADALGCGVYPIEQQALLAHREGAFSERHAGANGTPEEKANGQKGTRQC